MGVGIVSIALVWYTSRGEMHSVFLLFLSYSLHTSKVESTSFFFPDSGKIIEQLPEEIYYRIARIY